MSRFNYQTVQLRNLSQAAGRSSMRGQAVAAGVDLLQKASTALNGWAVSYRLNLELERMELKIGSQMPSEGGVLIRVGLQEWANFDPAGARAQMFLAASIAGAGKDALSVLQRYQSPQGEMVAGVPQGWRRVDVYIWATSV